MRKISLLTILALTTSLSACGGGGGSGGHIPTTTLPDTPPSSNEKITNLSTQKISNSTKRQEYYDEAYNSPSPSLMTFSLTPSSTTKGAKPTIDEAYEQMYTYLYKTGFDEDTNGDAIQDGSLRKHLILAGLGDELSSVDDNDLAEWVYNNRVYIKKKTKERWDMYGVEKDVSIENAKLFIGDDKYIKFIVDNKNQITGLELTSDDPTENIIDRVQYSGDDKFAGTSKLTEYGFVLDGLRITVETTEKVSLDEIKGMLRATVNDYDERLTDEQQQILLDHIDGISDISFFNDTNNDKSTNHGFHIDVNRDITASYKSYSKDMNLSYSDFGLLHKKKIEKETNTGKTEIKDRINAFAGGLEAAKIEPNKINDSLHFEGKAVAGVNYKKETFYDYDDAIENKSKEFQGTATLNFSAGKEDLKISFPDWYDVSATKDISTNTGSIEFTNGERITDEMFKFDKQNKFKDNDFIGDVYDSTTTSDGYMNIYYYGENNKPTEAAGYLSYEHGVMNGEKTEDGKELYDTVKAEIAFGTIRK